MNLISDKNTKDLIKKKREIQVKLSNLLNSKESSKDEINELISEIKYLDSQIEKKVGIKEIERLDEIKRKKSGKDEIIIKRFKVLNSKRKKISTINIAMQRFLKVINDVNNSEFQNEKVRIKN